MNRFSEAQIKWHIRRIMDNIMKYSDLRKYLGLDIGNGFGVKKDLLICHFGRKMPAPFQKIDVAAIHNFIKTNYSKIIYLMEPVDGIVSINFSADIYAEFIYSMKTIPEFYATIDMEDEQFELWFMLNYG